ncbi:hypothetical protein P3T76_001855 [Phytophthora citrophthora]|uniref:Uncharacterized protein n=1 Tax=Phytophthora citrophthora TaxID=4793 RepID=A0AAD9GX31_9STRA|nr:hypothetical protein P3T76_001855 [Phytophthora citrophthora]
MKILHRETQVFQLAQDTRRASYRGSLAAMPKTKSNLKRKDTRSEETDLLLLLSNKLVKRPSQRPLSLQRQGRLERVVERGLLQPCLTGTENATTMWSGLSRSGVAVGSASSCEVTRVPCVAQYLEAD